MKVSDLRQIIQSLPDDLEITVNNYEINGHSFNRFFEWDKENSTSKLGDPVLNLHIKEEEDDNQGT